MRTRRLRRVVVMAAVTAALAACGNTKVQSKPSHRVNTSTESTTLLAKLPKTFPRSVVPLPNGAPLVDFVDDSTKSRKQFQLTYASSPSSRLAFIARYIHTLQSLGFALKQHSYAGTPNALYSLEDATWEVLVEGSSSTVGISVVARK